MGAGKVESLLVYLEKYGEATTAYNDLRPFAEKLVSKDRILLIRTLTGNPLFGDSEKLRDGNSQSTGNLRPSHEDVRYVLQNIASQITDSPSLLPPIQLLH
jgi:N-terminal acetyltransferase B complex non-catalytic subunit